VDKSGEKWKNGLWIVAYGLWLMAYGLWFMVYGLWLVACGLWIMVYSGLVSKLIN